MSATDDPQTPRPDPWDEAARALRLCNACNYCNGYCEAMRAAERFVAFTPGDLAWIANLCHQCRSCWYACPFAPPHPFALNLPRTLAEVRADSWRRLTWPGLFARHPGWLALALTLTPVLACLALVPPEALFAAHAGPGAFYAVIPWGVMSLAAALPLGLSALGLAIGLARFWQDSGDRPISPRAAWVGLGEALRLDNLKGGGPGCAERAGAPGHARRRFHHLLVAGSGLCLAATGVATAYHHLFDRVAPYPLDSAPVLLGTVGGGLMLVGAGGLAWLRHRADPEPAAPRLGPGDWLFLAQVAATAASGLLLLALRDGPAMGILLALHLGTVVALFATLPYGKFAHAPYRAAALVRAATDRFPCDSPS